MPGAINIPWSSFHRDAAKPELGFKQGDELRAVLAPALEVRNKTGKRLVSSCGSGMSAALVTFAFEELGEKGVALYDGSWAGMTQNAKILLVLSEREIFNTKSMETRRRRQWKNRKKQQNQ